MNYKKIKLEKYFLKNSKFIKEITPAITKIFDIVIVIPVYNELGYFFKTVNSIIQNDINLLKKTLILCVINNPENIDKTSEPFLNNQIILEQLKNKKYPEYINLHWIDCSGEGRGLDGKGGVGVARKIGMDSCLQYLDFNSDPIICSLDADTLVQSNYLYEINNFFQINSEIICGIISFEHLNDGTENEFTAIQNYEYYLKYYVNMLKYAGSPYAYHSIGSAMTFKTNAYIMSGGMKVNTAGEDFYFLQGIRKLGPIGEILSTKVFQSSRSSDRVPFGTGPTVQNTLNGKQILLYNPKVFIQLRTLLVKIREWILYDNFNRNTDVLFSKLPNETVVFLEKNDFKNTWINIHLNNIKINSNISDTEARNKLLWCFNIWFDSFKTLKFVHFLERTYPEKYPRITINNFKALNQFYL